MQDTKTVEIELNTEMTNEMKSVEIAEAPTTTQKTMDAELLSAITFFLFGCFICFPVLFRNYKYWHTTNPTIRLFVRLSLLGILLYAAAIVTFIIFSVVLPLVFGVTFNK